VSHTLADGHVEDETGSGGTRSSTADVAVDVQAVKYGAGQENNGVNVESVGMEAYSDDELVDAFQEEVRSDELGSPEAMHLRDLTVIPEADTFLIGPRGLKPHETWTSRRRKVLPIHFPLLLFTFQMNV
jgi:hypothetical protein